MTIFSERVIETTTTTGTGTYSLAGAPGGARTFVAAFGSGASVPYRAQNADNTIWEERYGLITDASPDTLTRGTLIRSSTGSTISWAAGTKYIYNLPQASILDGLLKGNIGSSRPAWLEAGGSWIYNSADPWIAYIYDGTNDISIGTIDSATKKYAASGPLPRGHISGLTLSNNGTDATNDIDIAAGAARDGADTYDLRLASSITKRLDAVWTVGTGNGGLDTGSIANTTYHVWLIARADTGVVDVLFSTSASSPSMPANYSYKRRIGSIIRASGSILAFAQVGDIFILNAPAADVSTATVTTTASLHALSVPAGLEVEADIDVDVTRTTNSLTGLRVSSPFQADTTPGGGTINVGVGVGSSSVSQRGFGRMRVMTNTSRQVRMRAFGGDSTVSASTNGWVDRRGRDD